MMALLATLFLFSFILADSLTHLSICNINRFNISNVQYAVTIGQRMNYSTAVECCGSLNSSLAVLNNEVNGHHVMKTVVAKFANTDFWVDARRNATNDIFTWPDGSPVNASFWGSGEPQNEEKCARIHYNGTLWGIDCFTKNFSAFCQLTSVQDIVTEGNCTWECSDRISSTTLSTPRTETLSQTKTSPTSISKGPTSTSEGPTSTSKGPTSTSKGPTSTSKGPTSTSEGPTSTSKGPTSTSKGPTSTSEGPTSTSEDPTTVMSSDHAVTSVSLPTTIQPVWTTSSPPKLCACTCRHQVRLNDTTVEEKVKQIQEALSINKTALSSSVRKKSSSTDSRKSAQAMGLIGICILVGFVAAIIVSDVMKFFHACK